MLSVLFGRETENTNYCPEIFFNHTYKFEWFEDEIVKQIIKDVDNSEVIGSCVVSPVLGSIAVEKLSGGCKVLILLYKVPDFEPDLIWLGQNCESWLARISDLVDCRAVMTGLDLDFRGIDIKFKCLNDNEIITNGADWCTKCYRYIVQGGINDR